MLPSSNHELFTVPFSSIPISTIVSAFDPSIIPESGGYLYDGAIANDKRARHASGIEDGKKLWNISEQRVGQKFEI